MLQLGTKALPRAIDGKTKLDARFINGAAENYDTRLHALEQTDKSFEDEVIKFQTIGLDRVNQVLGPVLATVNQAAESGFLTALSSTPATLVVGQAVALDVRAEDRPLFAPAVWVAIAREDNPDDYAICQLDGYDRENGQLTLIPSDVYGDPGPHSDWIISSMAGSLLAGKLHRVAAEAARDAALGYQETTVEAKDIVVEAKGLTLAARDTVVGLVGPINAASEAALDAAEAAETAAESAQAIAGFDPLDYDTKIETDTKIAAAVSALLDGAPGALDTLNELAAALNDDASFAASVSSSLAALSTVASSGDYNDLINVPALVATYNHATSMMFG